MIKRVYEHKNDIVEGFTNKYHIHTLVYYEIAPDVKSAISREKQLKKWNRAWKKGLIEKNNPGWRDLYVDLISYHDILNIISPIDSFGDDEYKKPSFPR